MARIHAISGETIVALSEWEMCVAPFGLAGLADLPKDAQWIAARAPGTVAQALSDAGLWRFEAPAPLDGNDYVWRTHFTAHGRRLLRFHGLASIAEIFIDGALVLSSDNMFHAHEIAFDARGEHEIALWFRGLTPAFERKSRRAKWRTRLAQPPGLRNVRTTQLGRTLGFCPPVHAYGPYRAVELVEPASMTLRDVDLRATLCGTTGVLEASFICDAQGGSLSCAGATAPLRRDGDKLVARLEIPNVPAWLPHTHGTPHLHRVSADIGGVAVDLGRTGFRRIEIDRDADGKGFGLVVNGLPMFARGACWTSADLVGLSDKRECYLPLLTRMREAGMNMLRIGGTMLYEGDAFYDLCDELGLMIWQDFMFAGFDYVAEDEAFCASVAREARQFLSRTQGAPSLAVLCGGNEIAQQAAMFGLPVATWSNDLFDTLLPDVAREMRPDLPYVPNTPWGGALPFVPDAGVSHYYGVSAYMRELADARRAHVRFASECLCFANAPEGDVALEVDRAETKHDDFQPRVAGDTGSTWYFDGVRNHYLEALYDFSAEALRRDDPARYLDLSRAVSAEVMEHVFGEWRRNGSPTRGGLVWFLKDLWPEAGWGVLDAAGAPKAAYYGLKRAFRPVQLILTDEGLNGLRTHLINETAAPIDARLRLFCLRDGSTQVMNAERAVTLAPRATQTFDATDVWGGFFDTTYAYRFGPPSHDATIGQLLGADGAVLAEAFHFPLGRGHAIHDLGLRARALRVGDGYALEISTQRLAQSVHIRDPHFEPDDNWLHLPPGATRRISLRRIDDTGALPAGVVAAVNGESVSYTLDA
jgi:beta-mannosidase